MSSTNSVNITVVNSAGDSITTLQAVDVSSTTGEIMKQMVAQAVGFPAAGVNILLSSGSPVLAHEPLSKVLLSDTSGHDPVVTCVLKPAQPFGAKYDRDKEERNERNVFGSKGRAMAEKVIAFNEEKGKPIVSLFRTADDAFERDEIRKLITSSFHDDVAPLIDAAIDIVYRNAQTHETEEGSHRQSCEFESVEGGAYADLTTCQIWTRALNKTEGPGVHVVRSQLEYAASSRRTVVSAVLWRLLFNWQGSSAIDSEDPVLAGPVLEVLFLATHPSFANQGEASRLVTQLEKGARDLGCVALCVAAVPEQGHSFWTQCGLTVAVPLKSQQMLSESTLAATETSAESVLDEATTEFGKYLRANMLLFNDTPLMAKVLR